MLPTSAPAPQPPRRFGVGIDTSRYGHYAAFLKDDLQHGVPPVYEPPVKSNMGRGCSKRRIWAAIQSKR
jgi:hypothetical protein